MEFQRPKAQTPGQNHDGWAEKDDRSEDPSEQSPAGSLPLIPADGEHAAGAWHSGRVLEAVEGEREAVKAHGVADAAVACLGAGLSIVPIDHRTKKPLCKLLPRGSDGKSHWQPYQRQAADEATVRGWFAAGAQSFAVVGGEVSGGLLVLDFDVERFYFAWRQAVGELANDLPVQRTGSGHRYQVFLRCQNPGGNDRLAWAADAQQQTGRAIAIETRGEGGYAVVPPSLHPSGNRYEMLAGTLSAIPVIAQARVDALLTAARKLDECPHTRQQQERLENRSVKAHKRRIRRDGGTHVIEAFNAAHPIEGVLEAHGYTRGPGGRYIRPGGKSESVSVRDGRSCHWSSDDPLNDGQVAPGMGVHDAFDIYCHYEHGGDVNAAVKAAAAVLGLSAGGPSPSAAADDISYEASQSGIVWHKPTREGSIPVPLTNFTAKITADVVRDDGAEKEAAFELEATLGTRQVIFTEPASRFAAMNWPLEHLGAEAIVYPGQAVKDHARVAIQLLSPKPIPRLMVYTHTGWRRVDGRSAGDDKREVWVYLHGGGAIGAQGTVEHIRVQLPEALSRFALPDPPQRHDLQASIRASLSMLELAEDSNHHAGILRHLEGSGIDL